MGQITTSHGNEMPEVQSKLSPMADNQDAVAIHVIYCRIPLSVMVLAPGNLSERKIENRVCFQLRCMRVG